MPIYDFVCPSCGDTSVIYRPVQDWDKVQMCATCRHTMVRNIAQQRTYVRGDYKKPVVSDAMGFVASPDDIEEHRRRFPHVDLDIDQGCARPVFRNLTQKRKYMDAIGWADTKDFR